MNIGSGNGYPEGAISNFAPHPFVIDGVKCASMEGFLQSLKFSNEDMQIHVCTLVGRKAKFKGKKKNWQSSQLLHWKGMDIPRDSDAYQDLLDRAFDSLSKNVKFKKALLATGDAVLKHSIGRTKTNETVLTIREFCGRLESIRTRLQESTKLNFFEQGKGK